MNTNPFWSEQFPRPDNLPTSNVLPTQVDVAIVGSGYTGLNAARILAKSGATVVVLERHTVGWGASSRNGGMATPGLKQASTTIFKQYGKQLGRLFWQTSLDAIDLIEQVVTEENLGCDWERKGHAYVAYKESHFESQKKHAAWMRQELGHPVRIVEAAELHGEIGSRTFAGALVDEYSGGLQPAKYVFSLARAVVKYGVTLCENVDVTRVKKQSKGFLITTDKGQFSAKEVLIATNGYTDRLVPALKPKIFPVGSYIIVTEPLPLDLQKKLSPKGRMFYTSKWFLNYFRLTPDGRMLWGGRNNLSTNLNLVDSAKRLQAQMVAVFPDLAGIPVTHSWSGQLGLTFDLMPHIGRIDGIHYAFGYGGHGLSIATYLGTEAGLLLSGQKSGSPFAEIPHQTKFFYRNEPWFLPFAGYYYRFLDWVG